MRTCVLLDAVPEPFQHMFRFTPHNPSPAQRLLCRLITRVVPLDEAWRASIGQVGLDAVVDAAIEADMAGVMRLACERHKLLLSERQHRRLARRSTRISAINLNLMRIFKPLAEALSRAGLPFMLLKGSVLNLTLYNRPDVRLMTDIDLLIHAHHAERVEQVLCAAGCAPGRDLVRADFYPRYYYEREYVLLGDAELRLDVHVRPLRPLRLAKRVPDDAMWSSAATAKFEDLTVAVPSDEDMLIHLAAHSAIHGDQRLLWLYDIWRFVHERRATLDWPLFAMRVRQWGLTLPVRQTMVRTADLFDAPFVARAAESLHGPVSWADRLMLWQAPRDAYSPIRHVVVNVLTTPGLRFKLGYLAAVLLPDRVHMGEIYRFRHAGWLICAHLWRVCRAALRPLTRLKPA